MSAISQTASFLPWLRGGREQRLRASRDQWLLRLTAAFIILYLGITLVGPLLSMLLQSVVDTQGNYVGLKNFYQYLGTRSLRQSFLNTMAVGGLVTGIVLILAFTFAYGLTRTCLPAKGLFKVLGMLPILAPSMLPAISLIYLFGNQGVIRELLFDNSVYGLPGIVIGLVFWTFPHAVLMLTTALGNADARLYEAARVLKLSPLQTFFTVTLPSAKYGLISTASVIFTLAVTDFGVAKVVGGQYSVLATDMFKQVVGQQNFTMGAVTSVLLLLPAIIAFAVDAFMQRRQVSLFSSRSVIYKPKPHQTRDALFLLLCAVIALPIVVIIGMAIYGSLVTFWPWNMALGLNSYNFATFNPQGWAPYLNSLKMAGVAAALGSLLVLISAYVVEKQPQGSWVKPVIQGMAMIPMAVPGLVLGLGYIFFFNNPDNPLAGLYGTLTILVLSTVAHYYTVGHLTAVTTLKKVPPDIEAVAASLKIPHHKVFWRVTLPVSLPALLDIAIYLFVNALTTTSAAVFLYVPDTMLASIAVLNMEDAGFHGPASAMGVLILLTAATVKLLWMGVGQNLLRRTQGWR